jgi:hypothetical protein
LWPSRILCSKKPNDRARVEVRIGCTAGRVPPMPASQEPLYSGQRTGDRSRQTSRLSKKHRIRSAISLGGSWGLPTHEHQYVFQCIMSCAAHLRITQRSTEAVETLRVEPPVDASQVTETHKGQSSQLSVFGLREATTLCLKPFTIRIVECEPYQGIAHQILIPGSERAVCLIAPNRSRLYVAHE